MSEPESKPPEVSSEREAAGGQGELVEVFQTQDESEAMVVRGLLESAGITAIIDSIDAHQDLWPGVGGVILRVRPEQAEEASRFIEESRKMAESEPARPPEAE